MIPTLAHQALAAKDARLGVGHIWSNVRCPAYQSYDPLDCTCDPDTSPQRRMGIKRLVVEVAYDQDKTDAGRLVADVRELLETRGGTIEGFDGVEGVYVQ